jgi:hypothetical protein
VLKLAGFDIRVIVMKTARASSSRRHFSATFVLQPARDFAPDWSLDRTFVGPDGRLPMTSS